VIIDLSKIRNSKGYHRKKKNKKKQKKKHGTASEEKKKDQRFCSHGPHRVLLLS
jgi:hypothetical protein